MAGRRVARALLLVALVALVSVALAAATPPKGNRRAIAFYRHEADLFANLDGVHIVETGYLFLHADGGTRVSYTWGSGPLLGFRPATATVEAQMLEGRIVAYLAVLRAPRIRQLRILMAGGKVFTSTTRCWLSSDASGSPFGTGDSYLFNDGGSTFSPLVRTGQATTVGLTYRWSAGATARETDLFTATHPAPVHITIAVGGGLVLTVRKTIEPLTQAPVLPVPPAPNLPRPKPLCR